MINLPTAGVRQCTHPIDVHTIEMLKQQGAQLHRKPEPEPVTLAGIIRILPLLPLRHLSLMKMLPRALQATISRATRVLP